MRKVTILLSMLVLAAMVLTACGGGATSTTIPPTQLPVTSVATEPSTATEMPTEAPVTTETPGVPVTGEVNPASVSNELDFNVVDQSGNQLAKVNDMVLDLDNISVAYVIVDTGGVLDVGGKKVAVPWNMLQLQTATGTGASTGTATEAPATEAATEDATAAPTEAATEAPTAAATEAPTTTSDTGAGSGTGTSLSGQNVFVLQTDPNALNNAPEFDPSMLPQMGQSASGWDAAILSYWQGAGTGTGSNTPAPQGTVVPDMTGVATGEAGNGTGNDTGTAGTATSAPTETSGTGTGTGTGTQGVAALQGVALASDVIGATVTVGGTAGTGTGTGAATSTPSAGSAGTATEAPATEAPTETSSTGITGTVSGTIKDLIVNTDSGDIQFVVVDVTFDDGEHLIPVPLSIFQWDGSMQAFVLNADAAMLQSAPAFPNGQIPDTSMSGWDSQFQSFWQSNGTGAGSGSGSGGATPTATP